MDLISGGRTQTGEDLRVQGRPRSSSALWPSYPDRPGRTCTLGRDMMKELLAAEPLQQISAVAAAYQPFFTWARALIILAAVALV